MSLFRSFFHSLVMYIVYVFISLVISLGSSVLFLYLVMYFVRSLFRYFFISLLRSLFLSVCRSFCLPLVIYVFLSFAMYLVRSFALSFLSYFFMSFGFRKLCISLVSYVFICCSWLICSFQFLRWVVLYLAIVLSSDYVCISFVRYFFSSVKQIISCLSLHVC